MKLKLLIFILALFLPLIFSVKFLFAAKNSVGVVSSGSALGFSGNIGSKMSVPQWQVADTTENFSSPVYDYDYFLKKTVGCSVFSKTWNYGQLKKLNGCYTIPVGDRVLDQTDIDLDPGGNVILLVDGDVTIDKQITVPVTSFLAVIASGNITFGSNVGVTASGTTGKVIEGIYIANGTISTGVGVSGREKFLGRGTFVADANLDGVGGFNLQRTLGANNATYPAEYFEYRPDFLANFPASLGARKISWKEVAP